MIILNCNSNLKIYNGIIKPDGMGKPIPYNFLSLIVYDDFCWLVVMCFLQ